MIPGTCDIHVHASQAPFQGIGQNIENGQWNTWFDRYAFPDESRFNDPAYAELTYTRFAKSLLATPTTRLCAYATTSRTATETLMKALAKYRLCRLRWERSIWIEIVQPDCWKQQRRQSHRPAFG
ncbi:MAG: amidohydrolase family protein [Acutalibacteraceae bacterium]